MPRMLGPAADDVEVARRAGHSVAITPGDEANIKITTEGDFARAERLMEDQMDIRTGNGYDVHRFGPGNHVMLCGVAVPHERGLQGHSDADVGLHTVTDAIYGALAEGDIGTHFPPSDPQWKGRRKPYLPDPCRRSRGRTGIFDHPCRPDAGLRTPQDRPACGRDARGSWRGF
jgi:hypothetical protein